MSEIFKNKPKFFTGKEVERTKFYEMQTLFVRGDVSLEEILAQVSSSGCYHIYLGSSKTHNLLWRNPDLVSNVQTLLNKGFYVTVECDAESHKDMIAWLGATIAIDSHFCLNISVSLPAWALDSVALKLEPLEPFTSGRGVYTFIADYSRLTTWEEYNEDKEIE